MSNPEGNIFTSCRRATGQQLPDGTKTQGRVGGRGKQVEDVGEAASSKGRKDAAQLSRGSLAFGRARASEANTGGLIAMGLRGNITQWVTDRGTQAASEEGVMGKRKGKDGR